MSHYHLYAIGNALVDTEYAVTDADLQAMGVAKKYMSLVDAERRAELLQRVPQPAQHAHRRTGGGSAGNTVVALAQLGGRGFYSCRVADDALGAFYAADLAANGVASNLAQAQFPAGQTGQCMVFVTPDAERSMCTFLGATADLDSSALCASEIAKAQIYFMEGYLAASPSGLQAALDGKARAQAAGVQLATTLSDVSMIQFCRPGLEAILAGGLDYLFCNEEEAKTWCASSDWDHITTTLRRLARTTLVTRSAHGCSVITGDANPLVPGVAVRAVDTNGAGDMFAGAFLYGVTHGLSPVDAAALGNHAAAAVVSQSGNRLATAQIQDILQTFRRVLL